MTTYGLNIRIDDQSLKKIYDANQSVTLVKQVGSSAGRGSNVAWVTFKPFEDNSVVWIENYHIYGTNMVLKDGTKIVLTSHTASPVQAGWTYRFAQGQFTDTAGKGGSFQVDNQQDDNISFGLAQTATVNNMKVFAPLNAVPVHKNQTASFTPIETVSIYVSSYQDNGVVITSVAGNALSVELTSQEPTAAIGFNPQNNTFFISGKNPPLPSPLDFALRGLA